MPIDPDALGRESEPYEATWDSTGAIVYALGVGCGVDEPEFTTENSEGVDQQVLPTFVLTVGASLDRMPDVGTYDLADLVHAEQRLTLNGPLPIKGTAEIRQKVVGLYDKGKAAIVASERTAVDVTTGQTLFTTYSSSFIAGEGGWGGDRGPSGRTNVAPDRAPDASVTHTTSPDQALRYRLTGDRNRLHSDPVFARRGGFDRPILHGLCTFGFASRALLDELCGSDPARFTHVEGRFTAPVFPGDSLTTRIWISGPGAAVFTVARDDGTVVIDCGGFAHADV